MTLGRLEKVDLRTAWLSESSHFTPWLAQEENLSLLGEAIGIELELESQEKEVGPFRADILCKNTATGEWVLIENQLERTDHTHLGQLITYAAGLKAVTIVWIAQRFTEEHRAAMDWLNERTDESINLFGLEVELWRIGDSPVAPKFNIISQPNDWARAVKQGAAAITEVSDLQQLQLRFWTAFREYMESKRSFVKCQTPRAQQWTNHPIGRTGFNLASAVSSWNSLTSSKDPEIRAELYLGAATAKRDFAALHSQKERLEKDLGFPLIWFNQDNKSSCKLYVRLDADFKEEARWPEFFAWMRTRLEALHRVFAPVVRGLRHDGEV